MNKLDRAILLDEALNLCNNPKEMCYDADYKIFFKYLQAAIESAIYLYKEEGMNIFAAGDKVYDGSFRLPMVCDVDHKTGNMIIIILKRRPKYFGFSLMDDTHYAVINCSPMHNGHSAVKYISREIQKLFDKMSDEDKCLFILSELSKIPDFFK